MLVSLWLMAQFIMLTVAVALGPHLPHSPMQALLILAVGALVVAPVVPWAVGVLTRILALAPHAPPARLRARTFHVPRAIGAPGTPGTALARAPSLVAHASA